MLLTHKNTHSMSEIQKQQEAQLQQVSTKELSEYLDMFGFKDIPQQEKEQFVKICLLSQLNPFKREAYISAYGSGQYRKFAVITGYEVYIKRAEASGRLDGWNAKIEACKTVKLHSNGATQVIEDVKAVLTIHRKDFNKPFVHEVKLSEYVGKKKDGTPTQFWLNMPETMLKKVAMSQGFRLCFNEILGGMPYTHEEMADFEVISEKDGVTVAKPTKPATPPSAEKPELKEDTEQFNKAVGYLVDLAKANEDGGMDKIKEKYMLSPEIEKTLLEAAMDQFAADTEQTEAE